MRIKKVTLRIVAGANVAAAVMMALSGYSDRVDPSQHPAAAIAGLLFPVFLAVNLAFLVFWTLVRIRWTVLPLAGLILCFQPVRTYCPLNLPIEGRSDDSIKVLSYNVYNFHLWPDASAPCDIARYLLRENADIVCLQEIACEWDKAVRFNDLMHRTYHYSDTLCPKSPIALYSRWPVIWKRRIAYDSRSNGSGAFVVARPKDTVLVVVNHFESICLSDDEKRGFRNLVTGDLPIDSARRESRDLFHKVSAAAATRAPQARQVARWVARYRRRYPGHSVILCGDFNDSPISYVRRTAGRGLDDCYVSAGRGPGISYRYDGFYVRIDHIFCTPDLSPVSTWVDRSIKGSDHYPIVSRLKKRAKD